MKYWFSAILAFLVMAGASCAVFSHSTPSVVPEPVVSPTEDVSGLIGIVDVINPTARTFSLVLPDQSTEDVSFGEGIDLSSMKAGMLLRVDGARDRSTRLIKPTAITIAQQVGIKVTSPTVDATVTSPLVAFGFAKTDTGSIHWRLRASNGDIRTEGDVSVAAVVPGGYGTFRLEAFLPTMKDLNFSLELSVRDLRGADQQVVSIPLVLLSPDTVTFKLYFSNANKGSNRNCSLVFPVDRSVAKTSAVTRAAALELLKGPNPGEKAEGYASFFPAGTSLRSLSVDGKTATADFTRPLSFATGACQTANIRAEIAQTLLQFAPVSTVNVTVEGKFIPLLQP